VLHATLCVAFAATLPTGNAIDLAIEHVGSDLVLSWADAAPGDGYRLFRSRDDSLAGASVVHMTSPRSEAPAQSFLDPGAGADGRPAYYWIERLRWTERHRGIAERLTNERSRVVFAVGEELGSMELSLAGVPGESPRLAGELDPLYISHRPGAADGELVWQDDPAATGGYEVRRVDAKGLILAMYPPPEPPTVAIHLGTPPSPGFPVLDPNLITDPTPILFYSVRGIESAACVPGQDADNDRLDDCVETNTGIFIGTFDTGSDPNDADTDDDGIDDGDETLGTLAGLDLPLLGSNPLRQDMFSEHDWMDDDRGGDQHSHRPTANEIDMAQTAYASGPLSNPDGSAGIYSHNDYGQGSPFSDGNLIDEPDADVDGAVDGAEFQRIKDENFDRALKMGYFFYVVHAHSYDNPRGNNGSSGYAEISGNDCIVSTYNYGNEQINAGTIVHEQGHNLGLRHGGFENRNRKPNYNSTMNYNYQFYGVDIDCDSKSDGVIDYARAQRIDLDENDLDENAGVCGSIAIDWNCDSNVDTSVIWDVNCRSNFCGCSATPSAEILRDNDDWSQINLPRSMSDTDFAAIEVIGCQSFP